VLVSDVRLCVCGPPAGGPGHLGGAFDRSSWWC